METCYDWLLIVLPNGVGKVSKNDENCLIKAASRNLQNRVMIQFASQVEGNIERVCSV